MLSFDPQTHHRHSIRLSKCNYADNGAYFITICAQNKALYFGKIVDIGRGEKSFAPTEIGKIAKECWLEIPSHYPDVILDEFVIMPNHVHGILFIDNKFVATNNINVNMVRANNHSPLRPNGTSKTIGAIVRGYKIGVTKWARVNTNIYELWQRNYFEHIIRSEKSLNEIQKYILNNPYNWEQDEMFI